MLDDYVSSVPPTTVGWGTEGNIMLSHGVGTLRTRNHLQGGRVAETVFKNVFFVLEFGINILSVKHVASKKRGCTVLFMGGAQFYNREGNRFGWSPEPEYHTDLYR